MSSPEEPTREGTSDEAKDDKAAQEEKPQEPAQPSNDTGSTDGDDDDNRGDGCWNHPNRICLCRGRRSVRRKKRSKPKQKKYETANIPWSGLSTTYEPCVHLHFKTKTVSRQELTQDEYSDMLATPKGYRWLGQPTKRAIRSRRRTYRRKCRRMRRRQRRQKRHRGDLFANEYMTDMCEMMTEEMKDKMVELLTCEFAMKHDEADRIVKKAKVCKCKQRKKRRKPRISVRNVWIKEFSKMCGDKITDYIVAMLTKKRTPRVKKIAETILKHLCDITGEQTSLHSPKTKFQRLMVLFADRIALWLDEMFKESKKKRKKPVGEESSTASTAENSPGGTRPQTSPGKTSPEPSPDKTSPEPSPDKTGPETSPDKTSPKTTPDKTSPKTTPDKTSPKATPHKTTPGPKKSPDKSVPVSQIPSEDKLDHPPEDSQPDPETTAPKDKEDPSTDAPPKERKTPPPSEVEPKDTTPVEKTSLSKGESVTEKEKSKVVSAEKIKTSKEDVIIHLEEEPSKPRSSKDLSGKKESSVIVEHGKPAVIVISDEKKIKCTPGTTFAIKQGDGSHYEISKISALSIAEKVALARNRGEVPVRGWQAPKTLSPVNSASLREWTLWAKDVANVAEEWNNWIETTIREVEFKNKAVKTKGGDGKRQLTKAEKLEWENWKQKKGIEKLALRVENKKIHDAAKVWDKKVQVKVPGGLSKEEVTNVTDLAKTPSPTSTPPSQVQTPPKSIIVT